MYPPCDIDKVRARGETWAVDPELRDALNQLTVDLRGEIRTSAAETRAYVDERVQASGAEMRAYVDDRLQTSSAETRRYFDVVGESLRSDIRGVAEGVALLSQRVDRGFAEQGGGPMVSRAGF